MPVTIKGEPTAEQQKLLNMLEGCDLLYSVLGLPLPLESSEHIMVELGRKRVAEIESEMLERNHVLRAAIERELMRLEEAKG